MKQVIALCGRRNSGKDTAAGMIMDILEGHGKSVSRYAFADNVKLMAAREYGWDYRRLLTDRAYKEELVGEKTRRDMIVEFSDRIKRKTPGIFTNQVRDRIIESSSDVVIVTDLRLKEEHDMLKALTNDERHVDRLLIVRINRAGVDSMLHALESDNTEYETFFRMITDCIDVHAANLVELKEELTRKVIRHIL